MFALISEIFAVLKGLLELWNYLKDFQAKQAVIAAEKKRQALEKAIADLKNAETDEEIFDAQERITANQP